MPQYTDQGSGPFCNNIVPCMTLFYEINFLGQRLGPSAVKKHPAVTPALNI